MRNAAALVCLAALLSTPGCSRHDPARDARLLDSVKAGSTAEVHKLLDGGANVESRNESGRTPLMLAALKSNAEMVKLLLEHGADVNAVDSSGMTALMWAAFGGSAESVRLLIDKGAKIDTKDQSGKTALDWASTGKPEIRGLLRSVPPSPAR